MNVALSDKPASICMDVPDCENGAYLAHVTNEQTGLTILTLPLDSIPLPQRVRLVKIDAEGHEWAVLKGMSNLLQCDRPVLIVEVSSEESKALLCDLGSRWRSCPARRESIFRPAMTDEETFEAALMT